jgi:hypothetical protein
LKTAYRVKTFATEQKMLLFTQLSILLGLAVQVCLFFALLIWGRPPSNDAALVLQFFFTVALWVLTINASTVLFWWVSRLGPWTMAAQDEVITPPDANQPKE